MGGSFSTKEELQEHLKAEDAKALEDYEQARSTLEALDSKTRVPHLLVEVRSLGYVEVQGKNIGGIYEKLEAWLIKNWRVSRVEQELLPVANESQECGCCGWESSLQLQPLQPHHRLCDMNWQFGEMTPNGVPEGNGVYKARGSEGENNMGKLTMELVQFMTNECGWTFQRCDSGNLGCVGQIREQQMKFKAPHPLNLIAPHVMVELRQVGYIEINGQDVSGIFEKLGAWLRQAWGANEIEHDPKYCALKYGTSAFKQRGPSLEHEAENNMGMKTMELVDFMVKECQWTMVTCSGGNFGRRGDKREQQLVFRNDEFVQHGSDHMMVEFLTSGYIEVNALHDAADLLPLLDDFVKTQWKCKVYTPYIEEWESGEKFYEVKYTCPDGFYFRDQLTNNLGKRTIELAEFLAQHGWALLLCNGGSLQPDPHSHPNNIIREQQVKFTRAEDKATAPLLMIELRTMPYSDEPVRWNGFIEICGKDTNGVYEALSNFIREQMSGSLIRENAEHADQVWSCDKFRLKPSMYGEDGQLNGYLNGESNLGRWTMRLCDFMVDHLGEWDLVVCNSDNLSTSFKHEYYNSGSGGVSKHFNSVTAREMQLVFRHNRQEKDGKVVVPVRGEDAPPMETMEK